SGGVWQPTSQPDISKLTIAGGTSKTTTGPDGSVLIDVGNSSPIKVTGAPTVAIFASGLNNSYGQAYTNGAKAEAAKLGIKIDAFDGNNDPQTQLTQLQNAIASKKYNAFIVVPVDSKGTCNLLTKTAPAAGIVVEVYTTSLCNTDTANDAGLWSPG